MPNKKKLLITEAAMTVILIVFIAICTSGRVKANATIDTLRNVVLENISDMNNIREEGAMKLRSIYGLSENDYDGVVLFTPASNMDAKEFLLVKCKSTDQVARVEEAMKKRIDYEKSIFESYGVEQMGIINKAVVDIKGVYCLYICDENSKRVRNAFEKAIKK